MEKRRPACLRCLDLLIRQERHRGGRVPSLPGVGYRLPKFAGIKNQNGGCGTAFPFWSAGSGSPRAARARGRSPRGLGTLCSRPRSSYRLRAGCPSETLHASTIFEAGHLTLLLFQAKSDLMLNKQAIPANPTTTRLCDRSSEVIHSVDHRIGEYLCTNRTSPTQRRRTRLGGSPVAKAHSTIQDARVTDWREVSKSTRSWTKPLATAVGLCDIVSTTCLQRLTTTLFRGCADGIEHGPIVGDSWDLLAVN